MPAESRCLVFVRGNSAANLQKVRAVVPAAFVTQLPQLSNQTVIQAGVFNQDANAPRLISLLSSRGITGEKLCGAGAGNDGASDDPMTTADSNNAENNTDDNPDNIEITPNPPSNQPQGLPTTNVPSNYPVATATNPPQNTAQNPVPVASTQQQTVIPPTQLPVQFPTQSNCNCQNNNGNNLGANTIASSNLMNSGTTAAANHRYVTAVPTQGNPDFLLGRVKQFVPNAVITNSWRGSYIHAGAYPNRDAAESVSRYLRSQGIDSRVLFF